MRLDIEINLTDLGVTVLACAMTVPPERRLKKTCGDPLYGNGTSFTSVKAHAVHILKSDGPVVATRHVLPVETAGARGSIAVLLA